MKTKLHPRDDPKFSLRAYTSIIRLAQKNGYHFSAYDAPWPPKRRTLFLRHDVDYSPHLALAMARTNAFLGVRGTFFLLLRSQIYNLLSPWVLRIVRDIRALGQDLALHAVVPSSPSHAWQAALKRDYLTAKADIPSLKPVFSWHMPNRRILTETAPHLKVSGLWNCYSRRFTGHVQYFSDSNMRWHPRDFAHFVSADYSVLQLLFHPLIWVCGGQSMREVFRKAWPVMVREREMEVQKNQLYQKWMPHGMDPRILTSFAEQWYRQASRRPRPR